MMSGDGTQSKHMTFLAIYVPESKGSTWSQINQKSTGILSQGGNPSVFIKLEKLMEEYGIPCFGVDRLTSDLYAMEVENLMMI